MKKTVLLFILVSFTAFSQNINDYKYIIVPTKFDFLKEDNKYNLNTYTKLLLEKYGFLVYMNNQDLPIEIANNRCNSLTADLVNDSGFLVTKLKLVLKDCKDKIIYETELGTSREKEYAVAYNLAFRDAAKSFETLNYKYNGENKIASTKLEIQESKPIESIKIAAENSGIFYFAQPTPNGFQVVNSVPKVIMRLYNTSQKSVYIAIKDSQNGIVITKNDKWFFEYFDGSKLLSEPINLKF